MAGRPKRARVYFRRDGKRVLVVTLHHNQEGLPVEADGPLSLTTWDDDALGESIATALEQSATVVRDARAPASSLKVSGEPSPRAFESSYVAINLQEAGPDWLIQAQADRNLTLSATLSGLAAPSEFARQVTRLSQICRDRKF